MKTITINNTKCIRHLEFQIPEREGVYLLVGSNGVGKTTLLVCLDRICNPNGFARGLSASKSFGAVDQYKNATIEYKIDNPPICLSFRKKTARWAVAPKGKSGLLSCFGFASSVFIKADSNRISISEAEIRAGIFESADAQIKQSLNELFETTKYNKLKRLRNTNGRGRPATYFYVIQESTDSYYSEKRFSTGELALLRLVERLIHVENHSLILLDEAELALHPRIQKKLLDYLNRIAAEKQLTILISTHSITMIKATDKQHILLLEDQGRGIYAIENPCYPAKAIGCVDFMENVIYDAVFFVEDEMARLLFKKMLRKSCESDSRFRTMSYCILPVGGYEQTAHLAINTQRQLLGRSSVFAIWDADVFSEAMPSSERIARLHRENSSIIYNLGCTPEVWMIEKLESNDEEIMCSIRERFHYDVSTILSSSEYTRCNSNKPRKLAKQKMDVLVSLLSSACGDSEEIVRDEFANILIEKALSIDTIRQRINPILSQIH